MEPILDVFSSDAFSFVTLTDSINKLPFVPGRLGALGLAMHGMDHALKVKQVGQLGIATTVALGAAVVESVVPVSGDLRGTAELGGDGRAHHQLGVVERQFAQAQ